MSSNDWNPLDQLLTDLPAHDSEPARSARVRARCHHLLAHTTAPKGHAARRSNRLAVSALIGGFCFVYLSAVVLNALRSEGLL